MGLPRCCPLSPTRCFSSSQVPPDALSSPDVPMSAGSSWPRSWGRVQAEPSRVYRRLPWHPQSPQARKKGAFFLLRPLGRCVGAGLPAPEGAYLRMKPTPRSRESRQMLRHCLGPGSSCA